MSVMVRNLAFCALVSPLSAGASEPVLVESQVESMGLFKNGLLIVHETIPIPGPGIYRLETLPDAIHGTLWFEATLPFEVHTSTREEILPGRYPQDYDETIKLLSGKTVTVTLSEDEVLTGRVASFRSPFEDDSESDAPSVAGLIPVETGAGTHYVSPSRIQSLTTPEPVTTAVRSQSRRVPVLEFQVGEGPQAESVITMTYLTKGVAYAPSYRIDYDGGGSGRIRMSAVIRNEWRDFADTSIELISGYPSVQYSDVTTPLSHGARWSSFISQVSGRGGRSSDLVPSHSIFSNTIQIGDSTGTLEDILPTGGGEDLYFLPIGTATIAKDSSYGKEVLDREIPIARFIEWNIHDHRDLLGRTKGMSIGGGAWDTVALKNPFDFPLTTAPVSVWLDGRFRGQSTTSFVNPGSEARIRVTKSLSVETSHEEFDIRRGEPVEIDEELYRPVLMRAEMKVVNRRAEPVDVEVTRAFQGEFRETSLPTEKLRTFSRSGAVNAANEARWMVQLEPGEEKVISVDYELLIKS